MFGRTYISDGGNTAAGRLLFTEEPHLIVYLYLVFYVQLYSFNNSSLEARLVDSSLQLPPLLVVAWLNMFLYIN